MKVLKWLNLFLFAWLIIFFLSCNICKHGTSSFSVRKYPKGFFFNRPASPLSAIKNKAKNDKKEFYFISSSKTSKRSIRVLKISEVQPTKLTNLLPIGSAGVRQSSSLSKQAIISASIHSSPIVTIISDNHQRNSPSAAHSSKDSHSRLWYGLLLFLGGLLLVFGFEALFPHTYNLLAFSAIMIGSTSIGFGLTLLFLEIFNLS